MHHTKRYETSTPVHGRSDQDRSTKSQKWTRPLAELTFPSSAPHSVLKNSAFVPRLPPKIAVTKYCSPHPAVLQSFLLFPSLLYFNSVQSVLFSSLSSVLFTLLLSILLFSSLLFSTRLFYTLPYSSLCHYTLLFYTVHSALLYSTRFFLSTLLFSTLLYSSLSVLLFSTLFCSSLLFSLPFTLHEKYPVFRSSFRKLPLIVIWRIWCYFWNVPSTRAFDDIVIVTLISNLIFLFFWLLRVEDTKNLCKSIKSPLLHVIVSVKLRLFCFMMKDSKRQNQMRNQWTRRRM